MHTVIGRAPSDAFVLAANGAPHATAGLLGVTARAPTATCSSTVHDFFGAVTYSATPPCSALTASSVSAMQRMRTVVAAWIDTLNHVAQSFPVLASEPDGTLVYACCGADLVRAIEHALRRNRVLASVWVGCPNIWSSADDLLELFCDWGFIGANFGLTVGEFNVPHQVLLSRLGTLNQAILRLAQLCPRRAPSNEEVRQVLDRNGALHTTGEAFVRQFSMEK